MPWQELAHHHPSQHAEAVHVVAGNNAGMLHVWAASRSGQKTWQLVGIQEQVKLRHVFVNISQETWLLETSANTYQSMLEVAG